MLCRNFLKSSDVQVLTDSSDLLYQSFLNGLGRIRIPGFSHESIDISRVSIHCLLCNRDVYKRQLYNNVIVRLSAFFVNCPLFFRGIVCPLSEELSGSSIALHYCDINAKMCIRDRLSRMYLVQNVPHAVRFI